MKITQKLIADVITALVGEEAVALVLKIKDNKNVSEFKLVKELKMEIQTLRSTLYRLHSHNLVTYIRKKDRAKGWYVSYWTFDKERVAELASLLETERLRHFKARLQNETINMNNFFLCPKGCIRMTFHDAVLSNYKCTECNIIMEQQDNTRTIDFLKEKIRSIEEGIPASA